MQRFLNAIGKSMLTFLLILLIGYGWAFFEMKIMLKNNPELFGYIFYQQPDEEMIPDFNEDDVIIVKKNGEYTAGDRVMYIKDNGKSVVRTVAHTDLYSTSLKCATCDEPSATIDNGAVIGKAVGKIVYFGKFINFFKQKAVLITLAVIGFIFVVVSQYVHETPKKIS